MFQTWFRSSEILAVFTYALKVFEDKTSFLKFLFSSFFNLYSSLLIQDYFLKFCLHYIETLSPFIIRLENLIFRWRLNLFFRSSSFKDLSSRNGRWTMVFLQISNALYYFLNILIIKPLKLIKVLGLCSITLIVDVMVRLLFILRYLNWGVWTDLRLSVECQLIFVPLLKSWFLLSLWI